MPVAAVRPLGIPNISRGSSTEMVGVTFLQQVQTLLFVWLPGSKGCAVGHDSGGLIVDLFFQGERGKEKGQGRGRGRLDVSACSWGSATDMICA